MDSIKCQVDKNNNCIHGVSFRLQTVFTNADEVALVKEMAGGRGKVSRFIRLAAVEKAKKLKKNTNTSSLS